MAWFSFYFRIDRWLLPKGMVAATVASGTAEGAMRRRAVIYVLQRGSWSEWECGRQREHASFHRMPNSVASPRASRAGVVSGDLCLSTHLHVVLLGTLLSVRGRCNRVLPRSISCMRLSSPTWVMAGRLFFMGCFSRLALVGDVLTCEGERQAECCLSRYALLVRLWGAHTPSQR